MIDLRCCIDTNVLISAALFRHSVPRQALDIVLDRGSVLLSLPVILELEDVLSRPKLDRYLTLDDRMRFLVSLLKVSDLIEIDETIVECRDPKDDKLLELAFCGKARFLITGDADLLVLDPFRSIPILSPRSFVEFHQKSTDYTG